MSQQTTVFQSGNSQAVRLPKEFRFKSKTVEIFRRGDEVVLREKPRTLKELIESWPPLSPEDEASLDAMMSAIRAPQPPDDIERKLRGLYDDEPVPSQPKPAAAGKASKARPASKARR